MDRAQGQTAEGRPASVPLAQRDGVIGGQGNRPRHLAGEDILPPPGKVLKLIEEAQPRLLVVVGELVVGVLRPLNGPTELVFAVPIDVPVRARCARTSLFVMVVASRDREIGLDAHDAARRRRTGERERELPLR